MDLLKLSLSLSPSFARSARSISPLTQYVTCIVGCRSANCCHGWPATTPPRRLLLLPPPLHLRDSTHNAHLCLSIRLLIQHAATWYTDVKCGQKSLISPMNVWNRAAWPTVAAAALTDSRNAFGSSLHLEDQRQQETNRRRSLGKNGEEEWQIAAR